MAVFTPIQQVQLEHWLSDFDLGRLLGFEGIASGIENSNFFVDTASGRYVLTLFERLQAEQLPYYIDLMTHLAQNNVACPHPIANQFGKRLGSLAGKPAALVSCLPGQANMQPAPSHCAAVGQQLALMHLAARSYPNHQPNLRGLAWWQDVVPRLEPFVRAAQWKLLQEELQLQVEFHASKMFRALPRSAVHADLFRDNVLFDGDTLGGMIDFILPATTPGFLIWRSPATTGAPKQQVVTGTGLACKPCLMLTARRDNRSIAKLKAGPWRCAQPRFAFGSRGFLIFTCREKRAYSAPKIPASLSVC